MPLLTPRLAAVADLRAAGKTRRESAVELGLKPASVKKYLQRARRRAAALTPQAERYAAALSAGGRPVRVRPYSLLNGEA